MSESISQLTPATQANASDLLPTTQSSIGPGTGTTRSVTPLQLAQIDLSSLPTSNPGDGLPWLNGNSTDGYVECVGPVTGSSIGPSPGFTEVRVTSAATSGMTADTFRLSAKLNGSATSTAIYQGITGCTTSECVNADAVRGVATATSGTTLINVTGVAGYVMNQNTTTGPGQNAVALFGAAISAVNNASSWGINTLVSDNTSHASSSGTGRTLANEFDFVVTSTGTVVNGLYITGDSLAQPSIATGVVVASLGTGIKWNYSFFSADNASSAALVAGVNGSPSAISQASQPIVWAWTDGAGTRQESFMAYTSSGFHPGAAIGMPANSGLAIGDIGVLSADGSDNVFLGFDAGVPTIQIGNGTAPVTVQGRLVIPFATPASSGATGIQGEICFDGTYIYTCVATNTWHRVSNGATW